MDPDIDFAQMMAQFDTFLIGRKTFEAMRRMGSDVTSTPGNQNIVCSRTLSPSEYPHVTISADAERVVADLRTKPGKDIALLGAASCSEVCWPPGWWTGWAIADSGPAWRRDSVLALPGRAGAVEVAETPHLRENGHRRIWYDIERP